LFCEEKHFLCHETRQQFEIPRLLRLTFLRLSQWRHEFDSRTVRVKRMMKNVAMGRDSFLDYVLSPVSFHSTTLHFHYGIIMEM
jgi:hypothetical protein